jgi:EpsI family protein
MPESRIRLGAYIPAFVLLVGCAFIWQARSQRPIELSAPVTKLLPVVPGYTVVDRFVTDEERRVAGMTDYSARAYGHDTTEMFTTLVSYYDYQGQGKTIHSPRNCLPGAGWEIMRGDRRTLAVNGADHEVNHYILKNGMQTAVVYYWYQGRGRVVANEYTVKWNLLRDAALLGHTEEALVRVVVYVPEPIGSLEDKSAVKAIAAADTLGRTVAKGLLSDVARILPKRNS